jgi:hypothetical protein
MADALMVDTAGDMRPLIGHLSLTGCVAVARYLFAGATAPDGSVPDPVATPVSRDEAAAIRAAGLSLLLVDNGIGYGDTTGPQAALNGQRKAQAAIAAAEALGCPAGVYLVADLETWAVDPAFLAAYAAAMRAGPYGGAGIVYGSADAAWRASYTSASLSDPDVARMLCWTARYVGPWTGTPPAWDPQDGEPRTIAWQFCDQGPGGTDLSILRLPIPSVGGSPEGLWLPDGMVGSPKAPPDPQTAALAAQVASLTEQLAAAQATNARLRQGIATVMAQLQALSGD